MLEILKRMSLLFKLLIEPEHTIADIDKISNDSLALYENIRSTFGVCNCTYQVHKLKDLAETIRDHGPLRFSWLFPMERYNKMLGSFVFGSQFPENQMTEACRIKFAIHIITCANPLCFPL